jgi:hypothetical protein
MEFRNVNGPFDPALADRLTSAVAARFTGV